MQIKRRKTKKIYVGNVAVGGDAPITIQSMTDTKTYDVDATVSQVNKLVKSGADLVRISVPDIESGKAFPKIIKSVKVPIIADIHFAYQRGLEAADAGAACLRINPGNIGSEKGIKEIVAAAKANGCSIRIGINGGSLEKKLLEKYGEPCADAMVESGVNQIRMLEKYGFDQIKISLKTSDTLTTIEAYQKIAALIDYPLHLGITEAGTLHSGTVKSAIGLSSLLMNGIGDTLRVSLSEDPVEEIKVGWEILKALKLRYRGLEVVSCPTCARKGVEVHRVAKELEKRCTDIDQHIKVSIMGCVVNGIGEAQKSDIGLVGVSLEKGQSAIYINGEKAYLIENNKAVDELEKLIRKKAYEDLKREA